MRRERSGICFLFDDSAVAHPHGAIRHATNLLRVGYDDNGLAHLSSNLLEDDEYLPTRFCRPVS